MTTPESTTATGPLTHFDAGGQAHMVDVGAKNETHRVAVAAGTIRMKPETLALIASGSAKKGDVLGIARIAAIIAPVTPWLKLLVAFIAVIAIAAPVFPVAVFIGAITFNIRGIGKLQLSLG